MNGLSQLLLLLALGLSAHAMRQQAVGVEGQLMCGMKPAVGVHVKLYDDDDGPDPDDLLDEGYTDANGRFKLQGTERELTPIDPELKVYHDCDDILPGQRKVVFKIPNSYIASGGVPQKIFPLGTLNLETIFPKEERNLI